MEGLIYQSSLNNPYHNLAAEAYLAQICREENKSCLYLWQNSSSVIIGCHQNPYTECDVGFARENDIFIARRTTGGGAVYQDLGNLNFTLIVPICGFDRVKSTRLIASALNGIGIEAEADGRNDICVGGLKISGNAYSSDSKIGLHHGTLLYDVDKEIMERVLKVSENKLKKRGISSVKSRVACIKELYPDISLEALKEVLINAFKSRLVTGASEIQIDMQGAEFKSLFDKFVSASWIFGKYDDYTLRQNMQFDWGNVTVLADMNGEKPNALHIETDAVEAGLLSGLFRDLNKALANGGNIISVFEAYKLRFPENFSMIDDIWQMIEKL